MEPTDAAPPLTRASMRVLIIDLSSLFWSVAMSPAGREPDAPYEITVGRAVKLAAGWDVVAIACDGPGKSFRTKLDPGYKADRAERPAHLWKQIVDVRAELARRGYCVFAPPAYDDGTYPEGDDVIATLVRWYRDQGYTAAAGDACRIVSGDSDLAALIDDTAGVELLRQDKTSAWVRYTAADLARGAWDRVPVAPSKLAEFKALAGDSTDGYKPFAGAELAGGKRGPGIGLVWGKKLLELYGTALAAVVAAEAEPPPAEIEPAVLATLRRGGKAGAVKGLELASLRADVAIDCKVLLEPRKEPKDDGPQGVVDGGSAQPPSAERGGVRGREDGPPAGGAAPAARRAGDDDQDVRPRPAADQDREPSGDVGAVDEAPPPSGQRAIITEELDDDATSMTTLGEALATMPAVLAAAIVAAQGHVSRVEKDSTNKYHNYKYASGEDMIDEGRSALNKAGLALFHWWRFVGNTANDDGPIGRVVVQYTVLHTSGHALRFVTSTAVIPEKGRPEDKAEFGALTANLSYSLRGLLLIPKGDAEGTGLDQRNDSQYQPRGGQSQSRNGNSYGRR